jgi:hypothetical protein
LEFGDWLSELFEGKAKSEDTLRVLGECLRLRKIILDDVKAEVSHVREALKWVKHLKQ